MRKNNWLLGSLTLVSFALCVAFHLISAKAGHSHYRDLHLGAAITYAQTKIDFFHPTIVGFNATGTPTPQELPIWQALAGLAFNTLGFWFGWANLLSLLLFGSCLWPLYRVGERYLGARAGWWTLLFLLTQPLLVLLSGQASGDGFSFAISIWFLFFAEKLVRDGRMTWLFPAVTFAALSAVTKLPLYLAVAILTTLLLLSRTPHSLKRWGYLALVGLGSSLAFGGWTHYTNSCIARAEFPLVDLRVTYNSPMWFWYFGDWNYRLNPVNWAKGGWSALNSLFGSFALSGVALAALFLSSARLGKLWLLAACIPTLVFSHLVLVHRHYYVLFSAAFALLCASSITTLEDVFLPKEGWRKDIATLGVWSVLVLSAVQGLVGMEIVLDYDPYPHQVSKIISEHTQPQDKLLIQGGGWGGEVLFLSDRKGMSIWNTEVLEKRENLDRLLSLGYTKLVLISESPLLHSLQKTNPGGFSRERISYKAALTKIPEEWATIFLSDDILIKQLPGVAAR